MCAPTLVLCTYKSEGRRVKGRRGGGTIYHCPAISIFVHSRLFFSLTRKLLRVGAEIKKPSSGNFPFLPSTTMQSSSPLSPFLHMIHLSDNDAHPNSERTNERTQAKQAASDLYYDISPCRSHATAFVISGGDRISRANTHARHVCVCSVHVTSCGS